MWREDPTRDILPQSSDAKRTVPHARGREHGTEDAGRD